MNVHFTMSGAGSVARQRALKLVHEAMAKRETNLVAMPTMQPSINQTGSINRPSSQGGK
ncbi:hypothetical protein [Hyphomicrobium sp. 99]|uniref:hypothetical protein n=1 Tax=Hyphomicrobium sp. 99 TaxID=1163419 RepID=UPI0012E01FE4|nr:hypothetical protein [Hyphomicrobium sp. 99]